VSGYYAVIDAHLKSAPGTAWEDRVRGLRLVTCHSLREALEHAVQERWPEAQGPLQVVKIPYSATRKNLLHESDVVWSHGPLILNRE